MQLGKWQTIFAHSSSIFTIITLLLKSSLSFITMVLALGIFGYNIYSILNAFINSNPPEFKKKAPVAPVRRVDDNGKTIFNAREFQDRVRLAYQRNTAKKNGYFEEQNKYWSNKYFHKDDKIQELKTTKLSDLARQRTYKGDYQTSFQLSNSKKIRNFLQATDHKEDLSTISQIEAEIKKVLKKAVPKERIKQCLKAIDLHITSKISNQYDSFVNDFNAVDKVIHKCFSVSLSLTSSDSSQSISYFTLFEIIRMIDTQNTLPSILTPNFAYVEVKKEIASIRANLARLPDFTVPANLVRFSVFLKSLRHEFPDEAIILSGVDREQGIRRFDKRHIFKFTEGNRIYYTGSVTIKSTCLSTPTLLFLLPMWQKYRKTNRGLLRQVGQILEL